MDNNDESPLDVLSRAATMVSPPSYDEARSYTSKELPSTKWRKERQLRQNEGPLDFSTTHATATTYPVSTAELRAPPSYDQTIRNKCNSNRPSVIQSAVTLSPPKPLSPIPPSSQSQPLEDVCDPAIDEHFRRSLGKEYSSIFSPVKVVRKESATSDLTGLSVDDHFAKALGDTWTKLKEQEDKDKAKTNPNVNNRKQKSKDSNSAVITNKRRAVVTST